MPKRFLLFDLDGVLLAPNGYKIASQTTVKRIGYALGVPAAELTEDHIACFETANVTNEWDTIAICAALILVHVWSFDSEVRLNNHFSQISPLTDTAPDFSQFLLDLEDGGLLPGTTAFQKICGQNPRLNIDQRNHLQEILVNCRDIFSSVTLPAHQETILGSKLFHEYFGLQPQLQVDSFLKMYDRPLLSTDNRDQLLANLSQPDCLAGILTNRPNRAPNGYLSPPEAELGIKSAGIEGLPFVASGSLAWFAENHLHLPGYTLAKPNPVHALSLLQRCLGVPLIEALNRSANLWQGRGSRSAWEELENAKVLIFEDSTKGMLSGLAAQKLLASLGLNLNLELVGVSKNAIKLSALNKLTSHCIREINEFTWQTLLAS